MWVNDRPVDSGYVPSNYLMKFHLNCGWKQFNVNDHRSLLCDQSNSER